MHIDLTRLHSCTFCFPLTLPTQSRWLKARPKTEFHLTLSLSLSVSFSLYGRLALKSVMAAKKESVAKCAGPLPKGVGGPDGANTMIKTILAEADNSRVLVALDLKAEFQNVSRTTQKSVPTVGWIRVVPCQRVDFQLLLTQYSVQSWHSFARITTQVPNSLPIWTIGTCGSNRSSSYRQSLLSQQPPDRSILLYSPPRHRCGKALVRTPFHLSFKTRSHSHSVAWEDIYKSMRH